MSSDDYDYDEEETWLSEKQSERRLGYTTRPPLLRTLRERLRENFEPGPACLDVVPLNGEPQ